MNCPQSHLHLQARLDGHAVAEPADLEAHLAACGACRELHTAARRLEEGLRLLAPPTPPPGLASRIAARVLAEQRAARRFRRQLLARFAVAAGLLLTVFLGYTYWPQTPEVPMGAEPLVEGPSAPTPAPLSLHEEVARAGTAGVAVARLLREETIEPIRLFWPDPVPTPTLPGTEVLAQTVDPATQGVTELKQGVSAAGAPVTTGLRRWGDMFFRNLAQADPESRPGL